MFYIYADEELIFYPLDESRNVIQPKLTAEIGKAGGLEFSLPPNNLFYNRLRKLKTIIMVKLDEAEIFRGRVLSEERNFNNIKKIYCEGDLAYLIDSVQKGEKYVGNTHDLFRQIIHKHNARVESSKQFMVGTIGIENRSVIITGQSDETEDPDTGDFDYKQIAINATTNEWKTSYDYIQSCLIDYCGGYLRTRHVGNVTYIDLLTDFGHTAVQNIEFSKNLLDLTEEVTAEDLFTVLIPLGDDNLTIESVNNGSDELVDSAAAALYGRILKTHVFDSVSSASTLLENAQRYLASNVNVPVTVTVRAIDMHLIDSTVEEMSIGDRVHVKSMPHGIVDYLTCTKIELDLENPGNNTYTFGNPRQTMTERYRKDIQNAEDEATGGGGGGAAAEASESKANAWCTVLREQAFASIGASNEVINAMKHTLQTECGIDFDGNTGNINMRSMRTELDENGQELVRQGSYIHLLQEDLESRIELNTARVATVEGKQVEHAATIALLANDLESAIELKADRVSVDAMRINLDSLVATTEGLAEDVGEAKAGLSATYTRLDAAEQAIRTNAASITTVSNEVESKVSLVSASVDSLGTRTASLEVKANSLESEISAQADKISLKANSTTLNSKVTTINGELATINTQLTTMNELIATKVSADEIDTDKLVAKIASFGSTVSAKVGFYAPYIRASNAMTVNSKNVATEEYVDGKLTGLATTAWVGTQGFATESWVSGKNYWGSSPETGKFWLYVNGSNKIVSLGNHTHSGYATQAWVTEQIAAITVAWSKITGKPTAFNPTSHRHSFSGSGTAANGHTHTISSGATKTGGVSTNVTHTVSISGNTGYTGG